MNAVIKPPLTPLNPDNIPEALRKAKRWAPWAAPWDEKRQKYDKVPHRADRPSAGLSNGSTSGWVTFEQALAAYRANPHLFAGVGYLMTGHHGIVGVDLDYCIKDGVVAPWAAEIIAKLDSYTEVSPSGTGLHVMLAGDLDTDWSVKLGEKCAKQPGIDVYGGGARFLTVTGAHVAGSPRDVRPAAAALSTLEARYRKSKDSGQLHVLPLPDTHDIEVPEYTELGLPARIVNLLTEGPDPGADRSALLIAAGVALAGAGLTPEQAFALMVDNEHIMDIALDKRQYDDGKAREYLWTHHCRRGAAIYDTGRQLQLDEFDDLGAEDDLADILGSIPAKTGTAADDFDDLGPAEDNRHADHSPKGKKSRFEFLPVESFLQRKPAGWIIKGVLPAASLGVIFGASGSGKTFLALDLSLSVARGIDWRAHRVQQGGVAYVVAEGAGGFRDRVEAYCRAHDLDPAALPLRVLADAPDLMLNADVKDLAAALKKCGPLSIIVMDTYARVMSGNENEAQDANKAIAHCALLHRLTGAMVVLVHHSGKDAARGARGSGALRAAADVEIEVIKTAGYRAASITKMKDGRDDAEFQFKLADVVIGQDEDGEDITSCVVEHRVNSAPRIAGKPLTARQTLVLRILDEYMGLSDGSAHYAELKRLVADQIPVDETKKVDNRGRDVGRDIDHLVSVGILIQDTEGNITPAQRAK